MALKTFKFGIGEGYQEISLPEEHILQVIEGNEVPKLDDVQAATIEALRNRINSKPLQEVGSKGDKVAVIVSDITRGWIRTLMKIFASLLHKVHIVLKPEKRILQSAGRKLQTVSKYISTTVWRRIWCM